MSKMKSFSTRCVLLVLALCVVVSSCVAAEPKRWLIVEGGMWPPNPRIADKFRELIGGADAPVLFIPTAASDERLQEAKATGEVEKIFKELGLNNCKLWHTRDRNEANSEAFVAPLRATKGVWIHGGHNPLLAEAYVGTRVQKELQAFYERGGVIAGPSAGAMIMGSFLVQPGKSDEKGNTVLLVSPTNHEGFGLLENVVVVPHVNQRHLEGALVPIIAEHPELLGIGIDAGTGILVHSHWFEVIGGSDARVTITDGKQHNGNPYYFLHLGDRFDLAKRVAATSAHIR